MKAEDFSKILESRLKKIKTTLIGKRKEYATDEDVFYNFKSGAKLIKNGTPAQAIWGMAIKHLSSIMGMVYNDIPVTKEIIDEKIGDMIGYLCLLEGVFVEDMEIRIELNKKTEPTHIEAKYE